ncbi:MAG TPA: DUF998 domain-containing protein [Thermoplasmata archaeon]|nr:DUF998 domain-containing protein [Thermoplasmata archaeon]
MASETGGPSSERVPRTRSVRLGAVLWIVGPIQFVIAMIVVQLAWTTPYSLANNVISDLGAAYCQTNVKEGLYVCSPWHIAFDLSAVVFGLLILGGSLAVSSAFPSRPSASGGLACLGLLGFGAILAGAFPEDVPGVMHYLGSILGLVGGGVGILLLGTSMIRDVRWVRYRAYSITSGLLVLGAAIVELAGPPYGPLGFGGMERLALASILLWFVVAGGRLVRLTADVYPQRTGGNDIARSVERI